MNKEQRAIAESIIAKEILRNRLKVQAIRAERRKRKRIDWIDRFINRLSEIVTGI